MKKLTLIFILFLEASTAYCQLKTDSAKVQRRVFTSYEELLKMRDHDHVGKLHYVDSMYNFDVEIPSWLNLRETGNRMMFGGTLPAVDGIENAISIKIFDKGKFADLTAFKDYVIGDWSFGKHPKWSDEFVCYGLKDLGMLGNAGEAYRASHYWSNHIYTCTYVLVETKTAFLWIDFTATPTTYDVNEQKFEEFLKGFSTTSF
jgi:hypothetical protein